MACLVSLQIKQETIKRCKTKNHIENCEECKAVTMCYLKKQNIWEMKQL